MTSITVDKNKTLKDYSLPPHQKILDNKDRRFFHHWATKTMAITLITMAITSLPFSLFIVEESMQQIGFGVSAFNFNKYFTEAIDEGWFSEAKTLMTRATSIAHRPIPIVGLIESYFLFIDSAWFNYRAQFRVAELKSNNIGILVGQEKELTRVCQKYAYEYQVIEVEQNKVSSKELQTLFDNIIEQGFHQKESFSKVVGKKWFEIFVFEKLTITETQVPLGDVCP